MTMGLNISEWANTKVKLVPFYCFILFFSPFSPSPTLSSTYSRFHACREPVIPLPALSGTPPQPFFPIRIPHTFNFPADRLPKPFLGAWTVDFEAQCSFNRCTELFNGFFFFRWNWHI
ncbi:unnamed protein product [Citrullus colocynthis]|uniref:Uncharacterized protein n=1 Tax=Citrullus colocynthis TaxID=252529 RepID=A0ABP0YY58_9ROSI